MLGTQRAEELERGLLHERELLGGDDAASRQRLPHCPLAGAGEVCGDTRHIADVAEGLLLELFGSVDHEALHDEG